MHLTAHEVGLSVIAYEPVWAIGTGEFAKPDQLESVIKFVRKQVKDLFGEKASRDVRILYGGSVDEHVARSYMEIEGCDGVLVGGASLNYHKFAGIVEAAYRVQQGRMEKL
jgi:triosephosphate isomerase